MKISLVSYLNSYPYHYGLINAASGLYSELNIVNPAVCARHFIEGKSDVALVPVGALVNLSKYQTVLPYCISANGIVRSVLLLSNKDLKDIKNISPDSHSLSSNLLLKILCHKHWNIHPAFIRHDDNSADARVVIGDKAFDLQKEYKYSFDLSAEWKAMTGLSFVFAAWIAGLNVQKDRLSLLKEALEHGILNIPAAVNHFGSSGLLFDDAVSYLTDNIRYRMDASAEEGMKLFLSMAKNIL
jgi:chorismate dehydratase